jgi:NADPH2:quinone reductase
VKAIRVSSFGPPEVLRLAELPDPAPGPGEVAIDVIDAAVGLIDVFIRQGLYRDRPGLPHPPYVPGLEVAGTVRALGEGVAGFEVGEPVVTLSAGSGTGGYAAIFVSDAAYVASMKDVNLDPALAVAVVPNAATAYLALTQIARMRDGERVLVHGALGGLAAGFPGIARQLGASRVVGTVRASGLGAAQQTRLPFDEIIDSAELPARLAGKRFDIIIDPVGGSVRTASIELMAPGGRLLLVGNASGDWNHQIDSNRIWRGNLAVLGFSVGSFLPGHKDLARPAAAAAIRAAAAGLAQANVETFPLSSAAVAHERLENHSVDGRLVLHP